MISVVFQLMEKSRGEVMCFNQVLEGASTTKLERQLATEVCVEGAKALQARDNGGKFKVAAVGEKEVEDYVDRVRAFQPPGQS